MVLRTEQGDEIRHRLADVVRPSPDGRGAAFALASLGLGIGYYDVMIEGAGLALESLLIVAPDRQARGPRRWGLFQPLYGLRSETDWGTGSYEALGELAAQAATLGAGLVATLPLFAVFSGPRGDPSPYRPVSRLAFNELFIDVPSLEEVTGCEEGQRRLASADEEGEIARLRASARVDYDGVAAVKRQLIAIGARALFGRGGDACLRLARFLDAHPAIEAYARFRAQRELEAGEGGDDDLEARIRYHLYAQFATDRQLAAAARRAPDRAGLLLDLPVGVHPEGFDPAQDPEIFMAASCGAPPDPLSPVGQNWGLRPLHPEAVRRQGYRYVIACFRAVLAYAAAVRIDHIMGMERMYVVPDGHGAADGAYVGYAHEEIRAVALLEAARAGAALAGEDLGTVSRVTRRAMARDGTLRSFVYEFRAGGEAPLPRPGRTAVASIGTHDLPRWSAFLVGSDIDDLKARHLITAEEANRQRSQRADLVAALHGLVPDPGEDTEWPWQALAIVLAQLASSRAELLLVDIGDLALDPEPENRPGPGAAVAPWRHRGTQRVDELLSTARVAELLKTIDVARAKRSTVRVEGVPAR